MLTIDMLVPKAAVDKHDRLVFSQNQVRGAGQFLVVQPEAKPQAMQGRTYPLFWLRIETSDSSHHP